MPKPEVIEDYWGTKLSVELVFKSAAAFVYVDRQEVDRDGTFDRLTSDQARAFASQLITAADEAEPSKTTTETALTGSSERSTR